jgi:hypothetical protein
MNLSTLKEQAERCRRLAKHADSFTQRRLLDLASEYEAQIAKREPDPLLPALCGLASNDRSAQRAPFVLLLKHRKSELAGEVAQLCVTIRR